MSNKRIRLVEHEAPDLRLPSFACDKPLAKKLDEFPLYATMNRFHACAFVGRAGSGKTSIMVSMLTSPQLYRKVFPLVLVVMPPTSRASLKPDPFVGLPANQFYDSLTFENLSDMAERAKEMSEREGGATLMILDDVMMGMKIPAVEKLLVHLNSNRRHRRTCLWFCVQNYVRIPKSLRQGLTNTFLFSISKCDIHQIWEELLEIPEGQFENVCALFKKHKAIEGNEHSFLYWCSQQRFFLDFDELVVPEDESDDVEASSLEKTAP